MTGRHRKPEEPTEPEVSGNGHPPQWTGEERAGALILVGMFVAMLVTAFVVAYFNIHLPGS